jgi:endonuclease/exonuclease/phosphatase family metal-dependent hydrolase
VKMNLKVMTFNLRVMVADDGENAWGLRYRAVAAAIKKSGADIVCTQEAMLPMLEDLQAFLPEYGWIGQGRQGGNTDEHCAVFYRKEALQAADSGHFGLSECPDLPGFLSWNTACPRMCTWIRFRSVLGGECFVFNTHLDHVSDEAKENGIRLVIDRMNRCRAHSGLPAVLAGDFNSRPGSRVIRLLEEAGYRNAYSMAPGIQPNIGKTWHGFEGGAGGEPIDYIFVSPEVSVLSVSVDRERYDGRYPSDHYPVEASLSWGDSKGEIL